MSLKYVDFKVRTFFDVKYLENGTRQRYTYNGRLIRSRRPIMIYRLVPFSITLSGTYLRFRNRAAI